MSLSFNGNAEFKPRYCRWLQTGKVAEFVAWDKAPQWGKNAKTGSNRKNIRERS